ncbi:MAG: RNA polymerase sigma factor [Planctomycetes bacterium]|nr:RNA polymerase sigma factor [Planctomycetota bacterium]
MLDPSYPGVTMSIDGSQGQPMSRLGDQSVPVIGDEQLLAAFESMRDELVSTLSFFLRSRDDAMDIGQEAFLRCWKNRSGFGQISNIKAWIFRVALNAARDLKRSAWKRKSRALPEQEPVGAMRTGIDLVQDEEERRRVRDAVLVLRSEEREVFLLRQNGELTYEEIADTVDRPVGTVKTQMRSALQKSKQTNQWRWRDGHEL